MMSFTKLLKLTSSHERLALSNSSCRHYYRHDLLQSRNDVASSQHHNDYYLCFSPLRSSCRAYSASAKNSPSKLDNKNSQSPTQNIVDKSQSIRLSKFLSQYISNISISRRQAEKVIKDGKVTVAGNVITSPHYLLDQSQLTDSSVQVNGKAVTLLSHSSSISSSSDDNKTINGQSTPTSTSLQSPTPKVWIVHKVKGEMVSDRDPLGRPTVMERLIKSHVGRISKRQSYPLITIGRLDMNTEGLLLVTTDGSYARQMELPSSKIHRTYRVRVHGALTEYKLQRIRRGGIRGGSNGDGNNNNTRYGPMKVEIEDSNRNQRRSSASNTWLRVTCTEGKNRQLRNVFSSLGMMVTRLIRVSYGDYNLQTIPPGMVLEVPYKPVEIQRRRGPLFQKPNKPKQDEFKDNEASPIRWVTTV